MATLDDRKMLIQKVLLCDFLMVHNFNQNLIVASTVTSPSFSITSFLRYLIILKTCNLIMGNKVYFAIASNTTR